MGAGLDDKDRVEKIMGSEYCTIFINEATQISYDTFQKIKTRLSGQAVNPSNGKSIKRKIILDCNPRSEAHWIYQYFIIGKDPKTKEKLSEKAMENKGRTNWVPYDNPFLPKDYIAILENLTGAEKQRLLEGRWVNKEGLVYPNFESIVVEPFHIPEDWERFGAVDFGYTNPFVFLFIAFDKSNETYYLYDEHYLTGKTVREHAVYIKNRGIAKFTKILADHDAEDRATLLEEGLHTFPANKDISAGIQALNLMIDAKNGIRLRVFNTCVETIDEISTYSWQEPSEGKNYKEEPIKFHDHACDALRYFAIDRVGASFNKVKVSSVKVSKSGVMTKEQFLRKRFDKLGLDYNEVAKNF
jgi:phage terminase large subunit